MSLEMSAWLCIGRNDERDEFSLQTEATSHLDLGWANLSVELNGASSEVSEHAPIAPEDLAEEEF